MITIQKASEKDLAVVQEIVRITWPVTYGEILSEEQITYMLSTMYSDERLLFQSRNGHIFLLAGENGETLGFAAIEMNYNDAPVLRLHKIYVLPSAQGKKVGATLIGEIAKIGKARKQEIINLNVNRYNKAKNFYEKLGFRIVREEDIPIGNGYLMEDYVMELQI